jgi:hypothetical protein
MLIRINPTMIANLTARRTTDGCVASLSHSDMRADDNPSGRNR